MLWPESEDRTLFEGFAELVVALDGPGRGREVERVAAALAAGTGFVDFVALFVGAGLAVVLIVEEVCIGLS